MTVGSNCVPWSGTAVLATSLGKLVVSSQCRAHGGSRSAVKRIASPTVTFYRETQMTTQEKASLTKTYIMLTFAITGFLWWSTFFAVNLFGAKPMRIVLPGFSEQTASAQEVSHKR
jgi:hypothetical protein